MKRFFALSILALAISTGISYVAVSQNVIPQTVERSGCCSHHGGVAYCGKSGFAETAAKAQVADAGNLQILQKSNMFYLRFRNKFGMTEKNVILKA